MTALLTHSLSPGLLCAIQTATFARYGDGGGQAAGAAGGRPRSAHPEPVREGPDLGAAGVPAAPHHAGMP